VFGTDSIHVYDSKGTVIQPMKRFYQNRTSCSEKPCLERLEGSIHKSIIQPQKDDVQSKLLVANSVIFTEQSSSSCSSSSTSFKAYYFSETSIFFFLRKDTHDFFKPLTNG
jgi:hypothetical protein